MAAGRLAGADKIGVAVGKVINKYKVGKHSDYQITDTGLTVQRRHDQIAAEAALDGIYVLRTSVPADQLDAAGVITSYKTWPTSNATSASSRPTTSTCAPSTTASTSASAPTC